MQRRLKVLYSAACKILQTLENKMISFQSARQQILAKKLFLRPRVRLPADGLFTGIKFYLCPLVNQAQTIALYQPMLHSIAYRLVKCKEDAEDIVQETFVKWLTIDQKKIENTKAYLIKAVTNNCLKHLELLKKKKEECIDAIQSSELVHWFRDINFNHLDIDIDLKAAFRVLQTKLQPLERAVFLLKDVFDFDYDTLQETLDKNKEHCRQLLCRARKKLSEETAKIHFDLSPKSSLLNSFRKAVDLDNVGGLVNELKKEISAFGKKS